jgi:TRAP-type C4-dicarboxylate transport system substrate-binding protein
MNVFVRSLIGGALLASLATPAIAQTTLRVASWLPPAHPIVKDMMEPWAKQVETSTKGRIKVEILKAPLGAPPAHFDIVKDGIADVSFGVHGYTPGRFVLTEIAELPFLSDSSEALSVAYWRVYEKFLAKANEHDGVKVIGVFTHGPGHIFNAKRPVTKAADLDGLKIRVGGGIVNDISKNLGIVTVQAPSSKSYEILSNGVADGILFPSESVPFFKIERALKYMTAVPKGLYNTSFFVVMNKAKWDALPKEDQAAIDAASGEAFARLAGKAWDAADAAGFEVIKAAGIKIDTLDGAAVADLRGRLAFTEKAFLDKAAAKGVDGAAALKMLKDEIAVLEKK